VTGEGAEILELDRVLWRDDEAELMAITLAALVERVDVRRIQFAAVGLALLSVPTHAIADDVAQMRRDRPRPGLLEND
jgi:hypothetical protein